VVGTPASQQLSADTPRKPGCALCLSCLLLWDILHLHPPPSNRAAARPLMQGSSPLKYAVHDDQCEHTMSTWQLSRIKLANILSSSESSSSGDYCQRATLCVAGVSSRGLDGHCSVTPGTFYRSGGQRHGVSQRSSRLV
jgi:hypothetical protein